MKNFKVASLFVASCVFLSALTGCSSQTDWVIKAGDITIGAGQYIYYVTDKTSSAKSKIASKNTKPELSSDDSSKEFFKNEIDGKNVNDWIQDESLKETKNMLGARIEFDKLELSFTEEENSENENKYAQNYYSMVKYSHYDEIGIGYESYKNAIEDKAKYDKLFEHYYGENGTEAVSVEDKDTYIKTHGANYKYLPIDKNEPEIPIDPEEDQQQEKQSLEQKIETYKKDASEGKSIDDINKDYSASKGNSNPSELSSSFAFEKEDSPEEDILDGVFNIAQADGPAIIKETDDSYYIIQRFTPDQEKIEKNREKALEYMKEDEFSQKLHSVVDEKGYSQNNSAISKYSPKNQKAVQDKTSKSSGYDD